MKAVLKRNSWKEQRFDAFYREHYPLVYRAAYSVTHNRQDAEDAVQSVFLNVLRRSEQTQEARNIKGFLYRAAINEALFILRTRARQHIDGGLDIVEDVAADRSPGDGTRDSLREAITKLKPEDVETLILRYEYGYSDADIATMLGLTRIQVAVSLYRARLR